MSLSDEWKAVKSAWDDDESNLSPGTRFGLMFDPVRYSLKPFGLDDKYADFINKTGDQANLSLSKAIGSDDRGGWAANKPASTIGLMAASYFGGGAMLGGMGGGGAGGGAGAGGGSQGWGGMFANGGQGGLQGLGQGNAGQLFANTGINTGGVGGVGGTGAQGFMGSMQQMNPQQMMQLAQQMPGQQQQQQPQPQQGKRPYLYRGQVVYL